MKRALAAALAAAALTACASSAGAGGHLAASPSPVSCRAQYTAWEHGPARLAATRLAASIRTVETAAAAQDVPQLQAALKRAGQLAAAAQAYPMPRCADPHRYWGTFLARIRAGGDNASTGSGLPALLLAAAPLQQLRGLTAELTAELKHTVPAR